MSGNTFGRLFRLTTFGESHGTALGGVVDGCPAGIALDVATIQATLDRRRPNGSHDNAGTARDESDKIQIVSGLFEGRTTGTPIGFFIANKDQRSKDYGPLAEVWRPGHADMTYQAKYGIRDYRGGGRASGRETACRVAGGAIAAIFLAQYGIRIRAYTLEIGGIAVDTSWGSFDPDGAVARPYCAPDARMVDQWDDCLQNARSQGETLGGVVRIEALGVPAGLGEPVFDKLDALLAYALMSVGAVKGVEVGDGFDAARNFGSQNNDPFLPAPQQSEKCATMGERSSLIQHKLPSFVMPSNHCGGILGGISTGQPILLTAAVKPIPSIAKAQQSIDQQGNPVTLHVGGRHDICAIPRIVSVLESMTALVLADALLLQQKECGIFA